MTEDPIKDGANWYAYVNNDPVNFVNPLGLEGVDVREAAGGWPQEPGNFWTDNRDGTYTAREGATLWDLYGPDWREKSGFEGDPSDLRPGETVGRPQDPAFDFRRVSEAQRSLLQPNVMETLPGAGITTGRSRARGDFGRAGDYLGYASTGLAVLGGIATFTPAAPAAPGLFKGAAALSGLSAGAYAADEDYASMMLASGSLVVGALLPAPSYNVAAGRFTAGTASRVLPGRHAGRFVKGSTARGFLRRNAAVSTGMSGGQYFFQNTENEN